MASLSLNRVFRERPSRLLNRVWSFGGVDVAVRIHRHAFARRALIPAVLAVERRDESRHAVFVYRTDPDDVVPARLGERTRLRIHDVGRLGPYEDPARTGGTIDRLPV